MTETSLSFTEAVAAGARQARVVVLTGAGRAFCSGQDLTEARGPASIDFERMLRDEYEPMIRAVSACSVPTIAAVNGPAAGAGANLALAADVVIAAESAVFVLNQKDEVVAQYDVLTMVAKTWPVQEA